MGIIISSCNLFAVLVLTNLTFLTSVAYMILGVALAFIPISRACEKLGTLNNALWKYAVLIMFCGVTIFRSGYLVRAMREENTSVLDVLQAGGIVKSGPAMGLISDYMGPYVMNSAIAEWETYINDGDKLLIVVTHILYLLSKYIFCSCYNSIIRIIEYWCIFIRVNCNNCSC